MILRRAALVLSLLCAPAAWAQDDAADDEVADAEPKRPKVPVHFKASGHVKSFGTVSTGVAVDDLPDDLVHDLLNPMPSKVAGQGIVDARLNLALDVGNVFSWQVAHAITAQLDANGAQDAQQAKLADALAGGDLAALTALGRLATIVGAEDADGFSALTTGSAGGFNTGVGLRAPEAFPLTWWVGDDPLEDVRLQGRTDRFLFKFTPDQATITVGRQPITFGSGLFFTPMDLVNPFTPATIDSEYKPGVDAVRVDGFFGVSGQVSVVAAYTGKTYIYEAAADGEPDQARVTAAAYGQGTVGVTDLALMYAFVRGDHVVGASVISSAGPVGLHGDVTVTVPREDLDEDVFVRAVVGVDGRPTATTTLMGELYLQSFGSTSADGLFDVLGSERAARGEIWLSGLAYAGLSVSQEITPLIVANLAVIANLTEPSFFLTPAISWNVAANAEVGFGGFVGLGARPQGRELDLDDLESRAPVDPSELLVITPRSEFGTYPASFFLQVRTYF